MKKLKYQIDMMGAEIESSQENIKNLMREVDYLSQTEENDKIWELQLPPIDLKNFKEWWRLYSSITKYCHSHVEGCDDVYAGSMHVHLSFKDIKTKHIGGEWDFNVLLEIRDLMRKSPEKEWRDAITYRAQIEKFEWIPIDSKEDWITYNSNADTIEVRLNENPLPLWVYLLPIINNRYKGGNFKSYRNMFKKALKYWADKMGKEDFQLFERVVSEYTKHFGPVETIKKFGILPN